MPNLTGDSVDASAGAALALMALFGEAAQGDRVPRGTLGALGAPLVAGGVVVVQPDAKLAEQAAMLRCHELGREWGAVARLADVEPFGAYLAPSAEAQASTYIWKGRAFHPGVLHYLGTHEGTRPYTNPHVAGEVVACCSTCPSSGGGKPDAIVQHGNNEIGMHDCSTDDRAGSWVSVDLGEGRTLCPEAYAVRSTHHSRGKLRYWHLQGSDDGMEWVALRKHANDASIVEKPYAQAQFSLDAAIVAGRAFRYFRLLQTGPPSAGGGVLSASGGCGTSNVLHCAGLELYGGLDTPTARERRAQRALSTTFPVKVCTLGREVGGLRQPTRAVGGQGRWSALRRGPLVCCCAGARERRGPACTDVLPADSSTFPVNVCTFWP